MSDTVFSFGANFQFYGTRVDPEVCIVLVASGAFWRLTVVLSFMKVKRSV